MGELGHYLIGVTSKAIAMDLHYGDISCQLNGTIYEITGVKKECRSANSSERYVSRIFQLYESPKSANKMVIQCDTGLLLISALQLQRI